jgi:hypothetical protein
LPLANGSRRSFRSAHQHLSSVDDQLSCLDAIRRHLVPGSVSSSTFNRTSRASSPGFESSRCARRRFQTAGASSTGRVVAVHRLAQVSDVESIYYDVVQRRRGASCPRVPDALVSTRRVEHLLARADDRHVRQFRSVAVGGCVAGDDSGCPRAASHPEERSDEGSLSFEAVQLPWRESDPSVAGRYAPASSG